VIVVVTGTGTEVGKTFVTAALARHLRDAGVAVAARKPAQSYAPDDTETDADVLGAATGEPPEVVCPRDRWFSRALAPPMAADALGRHAPTIADLVRELDAPDSSLVLVEGAGGLLSPLAADGDTRALADALAASLVVLVADAGLGTINAVRLSAAALAGRSFVVFLNRFDDGCDLHRRNRDWLVTREGLDVETDIEALARRLERALSC
jgi:dethiobiotin synthetase